MQKYLNGPVNYDEDMEKIWLTLSTSPSIFFLNSQQKPYSIQSKQPKESTTNTNGYAYEEQLRKSDHFMIKEAESSCLDQEPAGAELEMQNIINDAEDVTLYETRNRHSIFTILVKRIAKEHQATSYSPFH